MMTQGRAAGILAAATLLAFAITAYGAQATGRGNGARDPTAAASFDRAGVGGRKGCEIQSWPDIAPECLLADDDGVPTVWKPTRRLL